MSTRQVVHIALFAALTAALGIVPPLTLPVTGVPITAQSLGPMLAGAVIGARHGLLSQVLFLALVAAGLPLLSGGRGGLGVFAGPSGGFLVAWPFAALVVGWLTQRYWQRLTVPLAALFAFVGGVVVVYAFGNVWLTVVTDLTLWQATIAALPFLPGDLCKVAIAATVAVTLRRSYPLMPTTASTTA